MKRDFDGNLRVETDLNSAASSQRGTSRLVTKKTVPTFGFWRVGVGHSVFVHSEGPVKSENPQLRP